MMKRIFMLAMLSIALCTIGAQAQTTMKEIFDKYKTVENAKYVHVPKWLMKMAGKNNDDSEDILSKTTSVKILAIDDCSKKTRRKIAESLEQLDSNVYEMLVNVKDDGDKCYIYVKKDEDKITELNIFGVDDKDAALVQLQGNYEYDDIEKAVNIDF